MTTLTTDTNTIIQLSAEDYPVTIEAIVEKKNSSEKRKYILVQKSNGSIEVKFEKEIIIKT